MPAAGPFWLRGEVKFLETVEQPSIYSSLLLVRVCFRPRSSATQFHWIENLWFRHVQQANWTTQPND